jgi:predicted nucleic acid-binding Zn ribbon protein
MNSLTESQIHPNESSEFARSALRNVPLAHAKAVNRTHRVVRERARVLQEKRDRSRSLMIPLLLCSVLLILSVLAVWTGLYQYQGSEIEAVQSDVASLADSNNHFMVVLLWFVPVSIALLITFWVRRSRNNSDDEAH